jgi:uncharacterized protein with HEPN domain
VKSSTPEADTIRLRHMLDAGREVVRSAQARDRSDLDHDRLWALGIVKCIEIIGEAASHVSPETRQRFPEIPWVQVVGMRNRLVHAYFDLDLDQVWNATTDDLPPLLEDLQNILEQVQ